jgi:hypothetical protein
MLVFKDSTWRDYAALGVVGGVVVTLSATPVLRIYWLTILQSILKLRKARLRFAQGRPCIVAPGCYMLQGQADYSSEHTQGAEGTTTLRTRLALHSRARVLYLAVQVVQS